MNCHALRNILDLLEEGRLSARREAAARAHLDSCAACRALTVRASAAPGAKAPDALKARLLAAARAARSAPAPSLAPALWPREAAGIALAAAALALVAGMIAAVGVPSQAPGASVAAYSEEP